MDTASAGTAALTGRRILVVEDKYMIGLEIAEALLNAGAKQAHAMARSLMAA